MKNIDVSIVMGSTSDWEIMKLACDVLKKYNVSYERYILSAHRTPLVMTDYAQKAKSRGFKVIIAGAGGSAHLPGMIAANTILPVIGVPVNITALNGLDSMLSIVQMPKGVPVATVGIDNSTNAGLLAIQILAITDDSLSKKLLNERQIKVNEIYDINQELDGVNYESTNTNETQKRNKGYRRRSNTQLCRKRFKNHSHFRRADLLSRNRK